MASKGAKGKKGRMKTGQVLMRHRMKNSFWEDDGSGCVWAVPESHHTMRKVLVPRAQDVI